VGNQSANLRAAGRSRAEDGSAKPRGEESAAAAFPCGREATPEAACINLQPKKRTVLYEE